MKNFIKKKINENIFVKSPMERTQGVKSLRQRVASAKSILLHNCTNGRNNSYNWDKLDKMRILNWTFS